MPLLTEPSYTIYKRIEPNLVVKYRAECTCGFKTEWEPWVNIARSSGTSHWNRCHRSRDMW